jgi:TatA/E family protein of Tat protein translocase
MEAPATTEEGSMEWMIVAVVLVALLYGVSRLPRLGRNVGEGIVEFKKSVKDAADYDPKAPESANPVRRVDDK